MADFRGDSREVWTSAKTVEHINAGSLQRIADATELMARRHLDLIRERDEYERRYNAKDRRMHPREKAAIAATLSDAGLLDRVRAVAGRDVGDPLNNAQDSVALREQFDLTVEFTHSSVMAFNDDGVCATLRCHAPDSQQWSRRAACVAVASMWTPAIGKAARAGARA